MLCVGCHCYFLGTMINNQPVGSCHNLDTFFTIYLKNYTVLLLSGYYSTYKTAALMSASMPSNAAPDTMKFSTPNSIPSTSKRKGIKDVSAAPITAKRSRKHLITNQLSLKGKNPFEVGLLSLHVTCP